MLIPHSVLGSISFFFFSSIKSYKSHHTNNSTFLRSSVALNPSPPSKKMATMESLIGLVNRIQRACTVLGDYGGEGMSLWEALPSVAVVGGQVLIIHLSLLLLYIIVFFSDNMLMLLWKISEFGEIFGVGKRGWKRLSASWIR